MAVDVNDVPLCQGDLVIVDLDSYGVTAFVEGRIVSVHADGGQFVSVAWDDDEQRHQTWHDDVWKIDPSYITSIVVGLAPLVPHCFGVRRR